MKPEDYQAAIPRWCKLRTFEEHRKMMLLCWGVTAGFAAREEHCSATNRDGPPCEFYNPGWGGEDG